MEDNNPFSGIIGKRVEQFVAIRQKRRDLKKQYEDADKPLKEQLKLLEAALLKYSHDLGTDSLKTPYGTAYTYDKSTASLADPHAFMSYVIETQQFGLLDRKANATAVKVFVKEKGALPPGCNLSTITLVGVRAPGTKAGDDDDE